MTKAEEQEMTRDIVSMLKASLMVMTNTRGDDHPHNSYQQNRMSPGVHHCIDMIESVWKLKDNG